MSRRVRTPAPYTVELCVKDLFEPIERDPHTMETIVGQEKNWIYPKIGATKLRDFTANDADNFFRELGQVLLHALQHGFVRRCRARSSCRSSERL